MNLRPITIVGGGLAGLTLGIGLRGQGIPVILFEKGHYPRHRVCGEFISGRGQETLARLGLSKALVNAGAVSAQTARFFLGNYSTRILGIQPMATCLSRFELDAALARLFCHLGGELRTGDTAGLGGREGYVNTCGRRPAFGGTWRWFGLKCHARNVTLSADLEMHCFRHGYVGLTRIENGKTNICGLFRRHTGEPRVVRQELLLGPEDSLLRHRLSSAQFDLESMCAVAGLPLAKAPFDGGDGATLGDSLTMIPPVTGNGMSMAFEAAEVAINPLAAYGRGEADWAEATRQIRKRCRGLFTRRLFWANLFHNFLINAWFQNRLGPLLFASDLLWRGMFVQTR